METARSLVEQRFPGVLAAFLAGSATSSRRSPTSDLDIVVVLDDDDPDAPFRETTSSAGWTVELFVHTPSSLAHYRERELIDHRPVLDLMCADGFALAGPRCTDVAAAAAASLARGPQVSPDQWQRRRYVLTDLQDDLRGLAVAGEAMAAERVFVAARLLQEVSHTALLQRGAWAHTGKAAARALETCDPPLLARLVSAHREAVEGQVEAMDEVVTEVLERLGGPLREGYVSAGVRGDGPGTRSDVPDE